MCIRDRELLFMVSTLRRSSARSITALIPYFAYTIHNQSEIEENGSFHPAADIARMLDEMGVDRVISIQLGVPQVQGYFSPNCLCINVDVAPMCVPYFESKKLKNLVVVSPSKRGILKTESLREAFSRHDILTEAGAFLKVIEDDVKIQEYMGANVEGKDCLIFDDVIKDGQKLADRINHLKKMGARKVYLFAVHALFTGKSLMQLHNSEVDLSLIHI
eukprot:TRINITY_DN14554_c0_g1_i1.p1 TRINITY_DN14554_c0_g1~~TRINITY_DN14554_c0_g1_i1.p1  ORF type:complete len:218 (+),score=36.14 TRINITY_DN14554_c0_g1_i1:64-717(+)